MNKVYFSNNAEQDISNIVIGLLLWTKVSISVDEAFRYVDDIKLIAYSIPELAYHQKCRYIMHKEHGEYQIKYKRNYKTTWYIIYNIDPETGDVLINKIINNHLTLK